MWVGQNIYLNKLGPIKVGAGYMGISFVVIAFGFAVKIQSSLAGQKVPWVIDVSNRSSMCWTYQATISRSWYSMPQLCISFSWIRTTCDQEFSTSLSSCAEYHNRFNLGSGFFNTSLHLCAENCNPYLEFWIQFLLCRPYSVFFHVFDFWNNFLKSIIILS